MKEVVGAQITFTVKEIDEGYDIPAWGEDSRGMGTDLLLRKGVYSYEYMDSIAKFQETQLLAQEAFFNRLTDEELSETDYEHAQRVWQAMGIKDLRGYHDLYLGLNVTLLADCFEHLRKVSRETFGLDEAHYYTLPGYAHDVMLKMTSVRLELLSDINVLQMIEGGIRVESRWHPIDMQGQQSLPGRLRRRQADQLSDVSGREQPLQVRDEQAHADRRV